MTRLLSRFIVGPEDQGVRLDTFLGAREAVGSRSHAVSLLQKGAVTVGGRVHPKSYRLSTGDSVEVAWPAEGSEAVGEAGSFSLTVPVLFEDAWLLVADKPAGMVVHPSRGHNADTLVHALRNRGLAGGEPFRPGIVHRLDRETSGLLIVAKDAGVHRRLQQMIRDRRVDRRYLALIHGNPAGASGTIDAPVGRDPVRRKTMVVGGVAARPAVTHFEVLERLGDFTLVEARLETGRTHQIRVHFLAIGHPVVGDPMYARRDPLGAGRQFLHSRRLTFLHPVTGVELVVESTLPPDLEAALERARSAGGHRAG